MNEKILVEIYILLMLVIFNAGCSSDTSPSYPYSSIDPISYKPDYEVAKQDFISDIEQYLSLIDEVHADPYRLISQSDLNLVADSIKLVIHHLPVDSIPLIDCYYYLQYLSAKIHDGHTLIRKPRNWRKLVHSQFPLILYDVQDTLLIRSNFENEKIPPNAEILSINGIEVRDLRKRSFKYISGTLPGNRAASWAKEFPFLLQTLFKVQPPWFIRYKFDGVINVDTIKGLPLEEFQEKYLDDYYSNQIKIDTFLLDSIKIPILKLSAFNYSSYPEYTALIDSFFIMNTGKQNIVIDIRDNTGGNGLWSIYLLDYFTNSKYSTYEVYKNRISPQLKKWASYQLNLAYHSAGKSPMLFWFYRLRENELYFKDIIQAKTQTYVELDEQFHIAHDKKYEGNVFIITSPRTFSAGVVFAAIFHSENMGIVVGNETGGRIGFNSDPIDVELKNSKLVAKIPTAILVLPGSERDRGLIPDIQVELNVRQLQQGKDPYLLSIYKRTKTEPEK